jgi:hypothetical protein
MSEPTITQKILRPFRRAILRTFPSCKEIVHIISASLDRPLTLREKFLMKIHLFACKPCVRYLNQSEFVSGAIKIMDETERMDLFAGTLSDAARARIKSALATAAS